MAAADIDREAKEVRAVRTLRASGGSTITSIPPGVLQAVGLGPEDDVLIIGDMETREIRILPAEEAEGNGGSEDA